MDTRKYEVFLCVADCGNLTRAAEKLGYTQSGITHMMNTLENDIGFPLLIRTNKGVSLSPEGERILPILRNICNMEDRLKQECALICGFETGNLRIGSFSSISTHWMPKVLSRFQSRYPNIHVETLEGSTMQLEIWLGEGRVDLCMFSLFHDRNLEGFEIMQDPFYAVLPKDHPLAKLDVVPLSLLAKEPFIMYKTEGGMDRDEGKVIKRMKDIHFMFSSNYEYAVIGMVEHGLGVCVMPGLILKGHDSCVAVRPIDPPISRSLGIAVRSMKELSPAMKRFIACAKEVLLPDEA